MSLLILAILTGLAFGFIRARVNGRTYDISDLKHAWLVPIAFVPQLVAFQIPATRRTASAGFAAVALVSSQILLLVFTWTNRKQPGFALLGLGLIMNLTVITLNGGLMPISPENARLLIPELSPATWEPGERFGTGKDIVLATETTRLWWLSDRLLLPSWVPYRAAYSIGDIFIAAGVFWWLFSSGRQSNRHEIIRRET